MRTNLARYLAAYAYRFNQTFGTEIDSISIQNEVFFESPFSSASYASCVGTAGFDCFDYYSNAIAKIRDYWIAQDLTIPIVGPGNGGLGHSGADSFDLWRQMKFIQAIRAHADAPDLENWMGGYQTNHYSDATNYRQQQVYDIYNNGWQAAPDFDWDEQPWIDYQLIMTGLQDDKPRYYTEAGCFRTNGWLSGAGGTPAHCDGFTEALSQQLFLTFGESSVYYWWTFAEDMDDPRGPRGHLLFPSQLDDPMSSDRYVVAKHFTRYIRPGATRIGATFPDTGWASIGGATKWHIASSTNVVAFKHDVDNDLVVVITNSRNVSVPLQINFGSTPTSGVFSWWLSDKTRKFQSQASHSWYSPTKTLSLTVPPYSVSTLVDFNTP